MSMEERFGKRFKTFAVEGDHNNHTTGVFVDDVDILKDFIRQEISLALQKQKEELVEQINSVIRETRPTELVAYFNGLREARNIIQQP